MRGRVGWGAAEMRCPDGAAGQGLAGHGVVKGIDPTPPHRIGSEARLLASPAVALGACSAETASGMFPLANSKRTRPAPRRACLHAESEDLRV